MMWKTLIFLAVASVVLAGKIKRHHTNYEFHIKHDYDYDKHHEKIEDQEDKSEEKPQEEAEPEHHEEKTEEEHHEEEEKKEEPEPENESDVSNTESEEPKHEEKYEYPGYEFSYKVKDPYTHDIKGHHEKKYGDEVKGVYWLLQPDGYKRTVDYHADKHSGFHAKVDYSKSEGHENEEHDLSKPTSEYYLTTYHGHKKYIPVTEEQEEEQEQDRQEESAQHIPIYII